MGNGNVTIASEGCCLAILFTMHLITWCILAHWLMRSMNGCIMDVMVPTQHRHVNGWGGHHGECPIQ